MNFSTLTPPQWASYVTFRWFFRALFGFFGNLRIQGLEHIPYAGPVILAPNHCSLADPWIMCALSPNPLRSLAAEDLFKVPGLKGFLYAMGAFPLKRGESDPAALQKARNYLAQSATLMIFPEGRCSPDGQPLPWLPGLAVLALRSGAPVVPIKIVGSREVLPLGRYLPRFGQIEVRLGAPIVSPPLSPQLPIRQQVQQHLERLQSAWQAL